MEDRIKVSVDILIIENNNILLGIFAEKWREDGKSMYGLPGREIHFQEKIGDAVKRNIKEELGCRTKTYTVIAVNANYAYGNHYIGIGVLAEIEGLPKVTKPEDWDKREWHALDKLPQNLFPPAKNLIASYRTHKITVSE